jgi:tetratricopeptide (TPR) repeat protein
LGLLYHWQYRNKESFEILAKALEYAPNNEFIQFKLALIASILKDWNASLIHYDKCININPNFYAAFVNRGIVYQEMWRI